MLTIASVAVSSRGGIGFRAGTDLPIRSCRFRARARPPRRPVVRQRSTVMLKYGVPYSRFMAPRFIDRVAANLKGHSYWNADSFDERRTRGDQKSGRTHRQLDRGERSSPLWTF